MRCVRTMMLLLLLLEGEGWRSRKFEKSQQARPEKGSDRNVLAPASQNLAGGHSVSFLHTHNS